MASSSYTHRMEIVLLVVGLLVLYPYNSSGLTYKDLVNGTNPIIPEDVRFDGNVTVERGTNGMVSFYFRGLPNHPTMKVNLNDPEAAHFEVDLPEYPIPLGKETCLTGGPIGWTIHGVALFNPFNHCGSNAVEGKEAEIFDDCQGHPSPEGIYHYHQLPDICVFPGNDTFVHGIARDGFPIYGQYKEDGTLVQESELDKCHGRCGVDGKYRYHMTKTYPYIMGCFRGTPMEFNITRGNGGIPPNGGVGNGIPPNGGVGNGIPPNGGVGNGMPPNGGVGNGIPPNGGIGNGGQYFRGVLPPPTGGRGYQPPPPNGPPPCSKGQLGPNQCAFNTVKGPNYEFQRCSANAYTANGSVRKEVKFVFVFTAFFLTWFSKHAC